MVRQRRVEQAVDVVVVLHEGVVALVVLAHLLRLVLPELFGRLEVALPAVPRVGVADQALAAHLRRVEGEGADAGAALRGQVLRHETVSELVEVVVAGVAPAAALAGARAAQRRRASRDEPLELLATCRQHARLDGQREPAFGTRQARQAAGPRETGGLRGGALGGHGCMRSGVLSRHPLLCRPASDAPREAVRRADGRDDDIVIAAALGWVSGQLQRSPSASDGRTGETGSACTRKERAETTQPRAFTLSGRDDAVHGAGAQDA
jgi:hypothetical protein